MMKPQLLSPIKRTVTKVGVAWGHLSRGYRVLPDFLIIGAQKAGTTSLYHHLIRHQNVMPARFKELHFFDRYFSRGPDWYRAYFPRRAFADKPFITGEATPDYLSDLGVPERIRLVVPDAKFIVLFRNPVERAYSHYHHNVRKGVEFSSFENAVATERKRILSPNSDFTTLKDSSGSFAYLGRGLYSVQIAHWLKSFPRDRFLFLKSEDLFSNSLVEMNRVFSFLDIPVASDLGEISKCNKGCYTPMKVETRRMLEGFFHPFNVNLSELTGQEFSW